MREIAHGVFVETGYAGINVGAILTRKGFIGIDAPSYPRDARDWLRRLQRIDPRPCRFLVLTNAHGDRILNACCFNAPIICHQATAERLNGFDKRYPQAMIDSLVMRAPEAGRELAAAPVERAAISFDQEATLLSNGQTVVLRHLPGPDAGNIAVHLPHVRILFTGDALVCNTIPSLAQASTACWLESLHRLSQAEYAGTLFIPGRGPLASSVDVAPMIAFLTDVRQRATELVQQGRPRQEIHTALADVLARFPQARGPREWLAGQLKLGLERIYDECAAEWRGTLPD